MRPHRQSLRVFESDFLERFTFVHPITPAVLWIPAIAVLIHRSLTVHQISGGILVAWAVTGVLVWSLAEWLLHRYVFHWAGESALEKRFHFIIHGLHHDDPNDPMRLVMPPLPAAILAVILFALFRLVLGPVNVEPFFAFFLLGYLWYDYTHYYVHHFTPTTRWGKMVKQHHMLHHFATHGARWGVSSPLWDYVFGTLPAQKPKGPKQPQAA